MPAEEPRVTQDKPKIAEDEVRLVEAPQLFIILLDSFERV